MRATVTLFFSLIWRKHWQCMLLTTLLPVFAVSFILWTTSSSTLQQGSSLLEKEIEQQSASGFGFLHQFATSSIQKPSFGFPYKVPLTFQQTYPFNQESFLPQHGTNSLSSTVTFLTSSVFYSTPNLHFVFLPFFFVPLFFITKIKHTGGTAHLNRIGVSPPIIYYSFFLSILPCAILTALLISLVVNVAFPALSQYSSPQFAITSPFFYCSLFSLAFSVVVSICLRYSQVGPFIALYVLFVEVIFPPLISFRFKWLRYCNPSFYVSQLDQLCTGIIPILTAILLLLIWVMSLVFAHKKKGLKAITYFVKHSLSSTKPRSTENIEIMAELKNASLSIGNGQVILADTCLRLFQKKQYVLQGVNGTGKTTLLKVLAGEKTLQHGTSLVYGIESWKLPPGLILYIPQESFLWDQLSCSEHVAFSLQIAGKEVTDAIIDYHIKVLNFEKSRNKLPRQLSGGMRRQLFMYCCILSFHIEPQLILLDEPSNGVDALHCKDIWKLVLSTFPNATVLVVTHNPSESALFSQKDGYFRLQQGKISISNPVTIPNDHSGFFHITSAESSSIAFLPTDLSHEYLSGLLEKCKSGKVKWSISNYAYSHNNIQTMARLEGTLDYELKKDEISKACIELPSEVKSIEANKFTSFSQVMQNRNSTFQRIEMLLRKNIFLFKKQKLRAAMFVLFFLFMIIHSTILTIWMSRDNGLLNENEGRSYKVFVVTMLIVQLQGDCYILCILLFHSLCLEVKQQTMLLLQTRSSSPAYLLSHALFILFPLLILSLFFIFAFIWGGYLNSLSSFCSTAISLLLWLCWSTGITFVSATFDYSTPFLVMNCIFDGFLVNTLSLMGQSSSNNLWLLPTFIIRSLFAEAISGKNMISDPKFPERILIVLLGLAWLFYFIFDYYIGFTTSTNYITKMKKIIGSEDGMLTLEENNDLISICSTALKEKDNIVRKTWSQDERKPQIILNDVWFCYGYNKPALKHLYLGIKEKEILGIVGINGSGKSTLANIILGHLRPSQGDMEIKTLPSKLCIVECPQYDGYWDYLTCQEICHLMLSLEFNYMGSVSKLEVEEYFQLVLNQLGLKSCLHTLYKHLSGGQKRLLAFVLTLIMKPDIVVLDEVMTGVDSKNQEIMWKLIREMKATCIIISHNIPQLVDNVDQIAVIQNGHLACFGDKEHFMLEHGATLILQVWCDPILENELVENLEANLQNGLDTSVNSTFEIIESKKYSPTLLELIFKVHCSLPLLLSALKALENTCIRWDVAPCDMLLSSLNES